MKVQWQVRRLKHLKHETSTKHQCAATITLEMTGGGAGPSAAHTGLALTQCSRMKEHSGASPSREFDVR